MAPICIVEGASIELELDIIPAEFMLADEEAAGADQSPLSAFACEGIEYAMWALLALLAMCVCVIADELLTATALPSRSDTPVLSQPPLDMLLPGFVLSGAHAPGTPAPRPPLPIPHMGGVPAGEDLAVA